MNILTRLYIAATCNTPFKLAWKRMQHMRHGHPFEESKHLDKLCSFNHPHSSDDHTFVVNIMECQDCGLIWLDSGLEPNNKLFSFNSGKVRIYGAKRYETD